jgi:CBS domain-containing protein
MQAVLSEVLTLGGHMYATVQDVLAQKQNRLITISPYASVDEAVQLMNQHRLGSVLVEDDQVLLGIFTERDVLTRVAGAGLAPSETAVTDVMTRSLITVRRSTPISEVMKVMTVNRCRHLPVVEDGKLLGLVSIGDVMRLEIQGLEHEVQHLVTYIGTASLA